MPVTLAPDPTRWVYDAVADMWHCLDEIDLDYWWQQEALREVETMCFDEYQVWRAEETSFAAWSSNKLASIAELEAEIARLQGAQLSHMADLVDRSIGRGDEDEADSQAMSAYAQIGLTLEVAPATADKRTDEALDLAHRLPRTLAALCAGTITLAKARVIAAETIGLTAEETERVEAKLLGLAAGSTPGALRHAVRKQVAAINSDALRKREKAAKAERTVEVYRDSHRPGMSVFRALLPTQEALALYGVVDAFAHAGKQTKAAGDDRRMGARRADALYDLITNPGGQDSRVGYDIRVVVPAGTLLGLNDEPGYIPGHGPIPAALCRELAADGTWRRLLTDPNTGHLLDLGAYRYRPSDRLREFIITRDQHCRFPGCRRPGHRTEVDHTLVFDLGDGLTIRINLSCLCKRHHDLKHLEGWQLIQDPDGSGTLTWVTPNGQQYRTRPPDVRTGHEPPTENLTAPPPPPRCEYGDDPPY